MELQLTAEQGLLAESIRELVGRRSGEDGLVTQAAGETVWQDLVDFGVLEIGPSEAELGTVELALIARALGECLAAVPLVDTGALLLGAGPELEGTAVSSAALGLGEPERSFAPSRPSTTLEGDRVSGSKTSVMLADTAALLALPADTRDGAVLALVRPDAPGVDLEPEPTLDPSLRPATVRLDEVAPERVLGSPSAVDRVAATAAVLGAAEAVGAAASVLALARDYAAERRQFGHPIGSFQAVRHLLADMVVLTESSWSSVLYAAASLDEREAGQPPHRSDRQGVGLARNARRGARSACRCSAASGSRQSTTHTSISAASHPSAPDTARPPTTSASSADPSPTSWRYPI